jgi:hypothetical protein
MPELPDTTVLTHARDAAARGEWRQAYDLLARCDAAGPLGGSDLELLATSAYAAGHVDVTIEAWERRHIESVRSGDQLAAAAAATRVALHLLFDTALLASIRGWGRAPNGCSPDRTTRRCMHG